MKHFFTTWLRLLVPALIFCQNQGVQAQSAAAQTSRSTQPTNVQQFESVQATIPAPTDSTKRHYQQAFNEIKAMLEGGQPISFKRAVFVTENAFFENQLDYPTFNAFVDAGAYLCQQLVGAAGQDYQTNKLARNWSIFKYMTDTVKVIIRDDTLVHLPFTYDFKDFSGEKDWRKMLVSKLLVQGTGNCHSMPYLYKMLADEMETEADSSLAPNHLYIKHRNDANERDWFNVELTSGSFPTDAWLMASGYITKEAIVHGTYIPGHAEYDPITDAVSGGLGERLRTQVWARR